jgi:hypothetical protein
VPSRPGACASRAHGFGSKLRALLATRTIGGHITRSDPEHRFLAFLDAERLRRPRRNLTVEGYEVDFHWPTPASSSSSTATPRTRPADAFEQEQRRHLQLPGYPVLRIMDRQLLANTQEVTRQLRSTLTPSP